MLAHPAGARARARPQPARRRPHRRRAARRPRRRGAATRTRCARMTRDGREVLARPRHVRHEGRARRRDRRGCGPCAPPAYASPATSSIAPVVGEEDGGLGTFALRAPRRHAPTPASIPEPTDLDLVPANGGALTFRLRVPGRAVHASRRTEGVSAIDKLRPVLDALPPSRRGATPTCTRSCARWPIAYPLSIGTVHAGDWASTVPDLLVAEGRLGVALGETPAQARAPRSRRRWPRCARATRSCASTRCAVEWWGGQFAPGRHRRPATWSTSCAGARRRGAAAARAQEVYGAPYGSDLRLLAPYHADRAVRPRRHPRRARPRRAAWPSTTCTPRPHPRAGLPRALRRP